MTVSCVYMFYIGESLAAEVQDSFCTVSSENNLDVVDFSRTDEAYNRFYAVHLSPILLQNCTAIAGALKYSSQNLSLLPRIPLMGEEIYKRKTLHHCIGGCVPTGVMGTEMLTKTSQKEEHFITEPLGHDTYAYLDLLKNFKGEIAGGRMYDLFTVHQHVYGSDSILIIPKSKKTEFVLKNPHYDGNAIFYDPQNIKLKELVQQVLLDQNSWRCSYHFEKGILAESYIHIREDTLVHTFFPGELANIDNDWMDFLKKECPYVGTHKGSPFRDIEKNLSYFDFVFAAVYHDPQFKNIWKEALPTGYVPIFKALILDQFNTILAYPFREAILDALKKWKEDCLSFIGLYEFDQKLRSTHQKSLFFGTKEIWSQILEARFDSDRLCQLVEHIPTLSPDKLVYMENQGLKFTIKDQFHIFINEYDVNQIKKYLTPPALIENFNEENSDLIKSFWYLRYLIGIVDQEKFPDVSKSQVTGWLQQTLKRARSYLPFYQTLLYQYSIFREEQMISLFNEPQLSHGLKAIINSNFVTETLEIPIDRMNLLRNFPQTKRLFEDSDDVLYHFGKLICNQKEGLSFLLYDVLYAKANSFAIYFICYPLDYPRTLPDPTALEEAKGSYQNRQVYNEDFTYEQFWDSLEVIFESLGILDIFKKHFSTKEECRQYRDANGQSPTPFELYEKFTLLKMQMEHT